MSRQFKTPVQVVRVDIEDGTAPSNPPAGVVYLYSVSGVLYYKDSGGTVTTISASGGTHPAFVSHYKMGID
jgi:hypothetical protein